jgi:Dolichyl-phosphate-mannose-protein mannosyltransferase
MRLRAIAVFLLLLVPSALYVWKNPDLPEFGRLHDDGILFVSAKSIAGGEGFRIVSLPGQPAQTKYPVLYPLFLSLVWKLNPHFPENLWIARLFSWLLLVVCLALCWMFYRKEGFSEGRTMILVALLGLNPYMILFGSNTFSEVFFMCWLLAIFVLPRRAQMVVLAGVLAGLAYLSRTAGIALLISMPAWYLWRRESRRAISFIIGMMPFVVGWMLWSRNNILHSTDQTLIYYTDYLKMELLTVGFDNFYIVLWKNIDGLLYGLGGMAIPQVFTFGPAKILTQVVGVAMICGTVRMFRRGIAVQYIFFAIVSSAMLIVWHFPPTERFVLPLCPLALAGLLTELEHIAGMLNPAFRHQDIGQRVVGVGMAATLACILVGALALQCLTSFGYLYDSANQDRSKLVDLRAAYAWIKANVPDSTNVLSNDDVLLYLYSGRRGQVVPRGPRFWYADDHEGPVAVYKDIASYCRNHGFQYFYSTSDDVSRWTDDPKEVQAVRRVVHENPELAPQFESGFGTVYKIGQSLTMPNFTVATQVVGVEPRRKSILPIVRNAPDTKIK